MKQSISYYITVFIIKLKGLKKNFSQDPIDFKKIRKEDVHHPKGNFFKKENIKKFTILTSGITALENASDKLLVFIHGGAFISGPSQIHWDTAKTIFKNTQHTVWLCDYPKAPEHQITEISKNIDAVFKVALEKYKASNITFIGDSVGGTLITSLIQRQLKNKEEVPAKIILISPVMHAAMSNQAISSIEEKDLMLGKKGVLSAKKMCVGHGDLEDELISPINGSFNDFPETVLFLAENDITYPDQKIVEQKLIASNTNLTVIKGKNMPHIWPLLPVMKEAKIALQKIIAQLND